MTFSKIFAVASLSLIAFSSQASLVTNGSFEANSLAKGTWSTYSNLVGWTGMSNIELRNNVDGAAQDGNNFVELDTYKNMSMKQTINIGSAGQYALSFWYSARSNSAPGDSGLSFSFGSLTGSVLENVAGSGKGNDWKKYTGYVSFDGATSADLIFNAIGKSNGYGGSLDNVTVTQVPEPETLSMVLAGLGIMAAITRRRKAKQKA